MIKNNKKNGGFTLIELLAVIVILGIIALIVVPNVIKMIAKSKGDAAVVSAKSYVEAVKASIIEQTSGKKFNVSYCDVTVKGNLACDDGMEYEVYAENQKPTGGRIFFEKKTIKSVENLVFDKFFVSTNEEGEYIASSIQKENIYREYSAGEEITFKGEVYNVVAFSDSDKNYVTLLKQKPLSGEDVIRYGENHTKKYNAYATNMGYEVDYEARNGYANVLFFTKDNECYKTANIEKTDGCSNSYAESDIKYIVDAWANNKFSKNDLVEVDGYRFRLITIEELLNLGYTTSVESPNTIYVNENVPDWVHDDNFSYWAINGAKEDTKSWVITNIGNIETTSIYSSMHAVRPVINVSKDLLR